MKRLIGLFIAVTCHAGAESLPVFDKDFPCTEKATADRYVTQYNIDLASFGGLELCKSEVDSKKLFNDLDLIERGQFTGATKNIFIRNAVARDNYYAWLMSNTRGVRRGNDVPTATAYNSGGYFTMQDGWAKLSTLGRVGVVIHEARHTEGFSHTQCMHGPYQDTGVSGCDESVDDGGSHAIEMEYYARVVTQGANFHPAYQSMARLMLLARANFVFNQNPMHEKDGLLARTAGGLVRIKDGSLINLQVPNDIPLTAQLKRTSFGATLLDLPGGVWAVDLTDAKSTIKIDDGYSYFKLLKMSPPANLRDVEEVDLGTKRHFFALDTNSAIASYVYGDGDWSALSTIPKAVGFQTLNPEGQPGIYASLSDGTYCALNEIGTACTGKAKTWPAGVKSYAKYKAETLLLDDSGVVRHSDGSPFQELQNLKVLNLINVPEYDVFE